MKLSTLLLLCALDGCGGSNSQLDVANRDPRCLAACPETMPQYPDIGAVCSTASRVQCLDECEVRIAGLPTVCQSCLLEKACFGPDGCFGGTIDQSCDQTTCTVQTELGSCSYPMADDAARMACLRKVDPRRDVTCDVRFRPTTECASLCT